MELCIWIYVYMTFSVATGLAQVTGHHSGVSLCTDVTSLSPKQDSTMQIINEQREEYFDLNSSVNLTCTSKNLSLILHTIWKIHINNFQCLIASAIDEDNKDTCKDGKVLPSMNNGESYIHIPRFTKKDEGLYKCEIASTQGSHITAIKVYARASLSISTRLDVDHRVAVCSATGATHGASISWRTSWNSTGNQNCTPNPDGTYDMESRVSLPDGVNGTDLECIVTHPDWNKNHTEILHVPMLLRSSQHLWQWIIISLCSICFLMGVLTGLCIIRKHLSKIRNCCKFRFSRPPPPPLPPSPHATMKPQDVEELEPYASYVQRVNSIYNSSAELCNV